MFNYCADTDCAYFSLKNPISTTVCEEICENVIVEYDATNTLVGVELLFVQQLFLPDLEPLKRFLSWNSYQQLLVKVAENKLTKTAHKH